MLKNILFVITGALMGFVIGFLLTNNLAAGLHPAHTTTAGAPATLTASTEAPPLDPDRMTGTLPPNHPTVTGAATAGANTSATNLAAAASTSATANSPQAQAAMEQADREAKNFDAQMNAAAVFYQLADYDRAALYLSRALDLKPRDADALVAMGDTKYDAGKFPDAATFYERALKERPQDVNVRTDLGNTFFRATPPDYRRAIEHYRLTLAIDPQHEKTLQNIALSFINLGDRQAAREHINRLAAVNPQNTALASLRSAL